MSGASLVTVAMITDLRLRRAARRVVEQLGSRAAVELIAGLVELSTDRAVAAALVERFAQLDPNALRVTGADQFPPAPVHVVAR